MGNEAGVPEFSNVDFCERARLPLAHSMPVTHGDSGIPVAEGPLKPRSQRAPRPRPRLRLQLAGRDFAFLCPLARTKTHTRAGGSVDFVREIVALPLPSLSPGGQRSHGFAAIRYATATAVICSRCSSVTDERGEGNVAEENVNRK